MTSYCSNGMWESPTWTCFNTFLFSLFDGLKDIGSGDNASSRMKCAQYKCIVEVVIVLVVG